MAFAVPGLLEAAQDQRNLLLAPDQRRDNEACRLPRLETAFRPALAGDAADGERPSKALEALRPEVVELKQIAYQPARGRADDHRAELRQHLQARCEVRHIADHRLLARCPLTDHIADHRRVGSNAHPRLQVHVRQRSEPGDRLNERTPGAHCLLGIVLVRFRPAK